MLDNELYQITQRLLSEKKLEKARGLGWFFNMRCSSGEASYFWSRVNVVYPKREIDTNEFFSSYPEYLTPTKLMRLLNEF